MTITKVHFLITFSMYFGTLMGIYWIIKFAFLPLGFTYPILQLLFLLFTLLVPVLGYILTRKYRDIYCFGKISFRHAFIFNIMMYSFASLLAGMGHYIYFAFIDKGYLFGRYLEILDSVKSTLPAEMMVSADNLNEAFSVISSMPPIELTFQLMSQNFFYCSIIAIPTALIVMRNKKNNRINN